MKEYSSFEASLIKGYDHFFKTFKDSNYQVRSLNTLYLGGGTPSLWDKRGAEFLQNFLLDRNIELSTDCEFTLEVNPGGWTEEGIEKFREIGANRFSLGIQSLNPNFIKIIDRIHNIDDVYNTLKFFNEKELSFSVDFMIGLPFSKDYGRDIVAELEEILSFNPEHISLYILTTKAGYIHRNHLPDEDFIEREYLKVSEFLRSRGFDHYEVSNFSKPTKESRHNLKYWRSESVMALGASATGFLKEIGTRYKWKVSDSAFSVEKLTHSEQALEQIYMALRINKPFCLRDHVNNESKLLEVIDLWKSRKYIDFYDGERISLNSRGFLMLDSLLDDLFKYNLLD